MSTKDDGGPAFPGVWTNDDSRNRLSPDNHVVAPGCSHTMPGMSLRDWFAGQVISGLCGSPVTQSWLPDMFGSYVYSVADAMLKARKS